MKIESEVLKRVEQAWKEIISSQLPAIPLKENKENALALLYLNEFFENASRGNFEEWFMRELAEDHKNFFANLLQLLTKPECRSHVKYLLL